MSRTLSGLSSGACRRRYPDGQGHHPIGVSCLSGVRRTRQRIAPFSRIDEELACPKRQQARAPPDLSTTDFGGGSSYVVVVRMTAEKDELRVQTRWKERDGSPTIVEASHLTRTATDMVSAADHEAGENT